MIGEVKEVECDQKCLDNYEPSTCPFYSVLITEARNWEITELSSKLKWLATQIKELNGSMEKVAIELPKVENKLKQSFADVVKETGNSELTIAKVTKDLKKEKHQQELCKSKVISGTTSGGHNKTRFWTIRWNATAWGLTHSEKRHELLQKCKALRNTQKFKNVYIHPDQTRDERTEQLELRQLLRKTRVEDRTELWMIIRGKVQERTNTI